MKKFLSLIVLFILNVASMAQPPEKISYQAIIRNSNNDLISKKQVGMKISIQKYQMGLPPSYQNIYIETQTPTTNENGLVSIQIGGGSVVGGTFSTINWSEGIYYIKTEIDPAGGTNYTITAQSQLLSVPYALNAKTVQNINTDATIDGEGNTTSPLKIAQQSATSGQVLKWNGTAWTPETVTKLGTSNIDVQKMNVHSFRTGTTVPLQITYQDLGLESAADLNQLMIISLEVGWNPNIGELNPREYRSIKDGIYYETSLAPSTFQGIKIYFPDKSEYHLQFGKLFYVLY